MKAENFKTIFKNIGKNIPFLISACAVLFLFVAPSVISLFPILAIFVAAFAVSVLNIKKPAANTSLLSMLSCVLLSILILFTGYDTFLKTWANFTFVKETAEKAGITALTLLNIISLVCCILGFYAAYFLSCFIIHFIKKTFKKYLPVQEKSQLKSNIVKNWYFPISALALFCLNAVLTLGYFIGILIAFISAIIISSQFSSVIKYIRQNSTSVKIISFLTSFGICFTSISVFILRWKNTKNHEEIMLTKTLSATEIAGVILAVASFLFVYFFVTVFWQRIFITVKDTKLFKNIKAGEWIVYGILFAASLTLVIFAFIQTNVFYAGKVDCDVIYTADSPMLVKNYVYINLTFAENDLRQPLFAVFSAPFTGIMYLAADLTGASASVQAILINSVQLALLLVSNFILTKIMKLTPVKRICFMILSCCTYSYLLFSLMMEQYIFAYFWLVFGLYLICEKRQDDGIAFCGTGGTLLIGLVTLPFMSHQSPVKNFKNWLNDILKYSIEFIALLLVFCRFDVIFGLITKLTSLSGFTDGKVTLSNKLYQYTNFIHNCFLPPEASANTTAFTHISWQLEKPDGINIIGVIILLLAVISAAVNRKKISSLISLGWIGFSVIVLVVIGWGTNENGLILYSLYFGWAFLVLLFQLVEKIEEKLKVKFILPVISICAAGLMAAANIPAIIEMTEFAIKNYPL